MTVKSMMVAGFVLLLAQPVYAAESKKAVVPAKKPVAIATKSPAAPVSVSVPARKPLAEKAAAKPVKTAGVLIDPNEAKKTNKPKPVKLAAGTASLKQKTDKKSNLAKIAAAPVASAMTDEADTGKLAAFIPDGDGAEQLGPPPAKRGGWQCVTYAREIVPVKLFGNAWTWWQQATQKNYNTGNDPKLGSVLVFRKTPKMRYGHVAVVRQILNEREILIEHANWAPRGGAGRGHVDTADKIVDVSPNNDWTEVRMFYDSNDTMGRVNPAYGFIYSPDTDPRTGITWNNG